MTPIIALVQEIPNIMATNIICLRDNPELYTLKTANHDMQLAFYWITEASREMQSSLEETTLDTQTDELPSGLVKPPSLIGVREQLKFMKTGLKTITDKMFEYLMETPLSPATEYKLKQGYNKLKEAEFNAIIAQSYYEQIEQDRDGREPD